MNFNKIIDRTKSESEKWRMFPKDELPMFVADMDFLTPSCVIKALSKRVAHGFFGYTHVLDSHKKIVQSMLQKKYKYKTDLEPIIFLPSLVSGLAVIGRMAKSENKKVIAPVPCYPPFTLAPHDAGAEVIKCKLAKNGMDYSFDYAALNKAVSAGGRYLLLCNPHNPTGHVYTESELKELAGWAEKKDVIIVSDEIHCELILDESKKHMPFACISRAAAERTITLMAPSKTYNVPGIGIGFAVIKNKELRQKFIKLRRFIVPETGIMGLTVLSAVYKNSAAEKWRKEILKYLKANRELVCKTLKPYKKLIDVSRPEGTYLTWIDCRRCQWDDPWMEFRKQGKVVLGNGRYFHDSQCVRLTFACPKPLLLAGLKRITKVLEKRLVELKAA